MRRATLRTCPLPYSQACDTVRAASCGARRTGCGTVSLGNDLDIRSKAHPFMREHLRQHARSRVVNGFRHSGLRELGGTDISDNDVGKVFDRLGRDLVQKIISLISDFGGQSAGAFLQAETLKSRQSSLCFPVELRRFDLRAIAQCGERLEPKIDANGRSIAMLRFRHLDLDIGIPSTARVGADVRGFWLTILRPRTPILKAEPASEQRKRIAIQLRRPIEIREWDPGQRAIMAAEARRLRKDLVTRIGKLFAYCVDGIGVDVELFRNAAAKIDEIECRWALDAGASPLSIGGAPIRLDAEIPDEIDRTRLRRRRVPRGRCAVFNTVAVSQNHRRHPTIARAVYVKSTEASSWRFRFPPRSQGRSPLRGSG
jgi:hypothetical protein